jgi:hypothetical protein
MAMPKRPRSQITPPSKLLKQSKIRVNRVSTVLLPSCRSWTQAEVSKECRAGCAKISNCQLQEPFSLLPSLVRFVGSGDQYSSVFEQAYFDPSRSFDLEQPTDFLSKLSWRYLARLLVSLRSVLSHVAGSRSLVHSAWAIDVAVAVAVRGCD